jgi:hypothetical protein
MLLCGTKVPIGADLKGEAMSAPFEERGQGQQPKEVEVHVQSLKTNAKAKFKIAETATVDEVWTHASGELGEPRTAGDTFRCKDGTDLMDRLGSTLAEVFEANVCRQRQFEFRGPSGGA